MSAATEPPIQPASMKGAPRKRLLAYFGANAFALSILLHVVFGIGATFLIVEHFTKKHVNFHATEPPAPHTEIEHKVQLAKRNNIESAPPDLKRIVTTALSPVSLPDVPVSTADTETEPSPISGLNGVVGMGEGAGLGGGSGSGGGSPLFGAAGGDGFVGTFYDLKQTAEGQPTPMAAWGPETRTPELCAHWENFPSTRAEMEFLRSFITSWNPMILEDYYRSPVELTTPQIYVPKLKATVAPQAFHAEQKVQPRRWIVVYRVRIIPPKSGRFRFVGMGDDFLMVRINDLNVLDANWPPQDVMRSVNSRDDVGTAAEGQPLYAGAWVDMQQGIAMDMQVLIGEGPGGDGAFFLLIQEQGVNYPKGDYPVFQLADVPIPPSGGPGTVPPAFSGKKMIFGFESK